MLLNYTVGELYLKLVVSPLWISSDSVINVIKSFPVPVGRAPASRLVRAAARISENCKYIHSIFCRSHGVIYDHLFLGNTCTEGDLRLNFG